MAIQSRPGRIRVLIADDHLLVRVGLMSIINDELDMQVVAEAANGREAIAEYRTHQPDVVLLDLRMPGPSGVDVIAALRAQDPAARVIVLTVHKGEESVYQAVRAGVHAYLLKDVPREELLATIRAVAAGQSRLPAGLLNSLCHRLGKEDPSPREREVLKLIATGRSNREIAELLGIGETTVKKRVGAVLAKLGAENRTQAVSLAAEHGIIDLTDLGADQRP